MKESPMRIASCITALLLATAAGAAQADLIEIQWDKAGRFEHGPTLLPAKFAELCGKLEPGQRVSWSFKSDAALNFNIHYHEGEQVVYPARQNGVAEASGELKVEKAQTYCWMWSNKGTAPARLQLQLQR